MLVNPNPVRADSPSDLLEQGIYSEETKGDLDGAVQLYQKVIAQSKSDLALAAQAQYHLGACYYKMQDYTNATAAFEQVVKEYPDQTNIVARARKYLAGAAVVPLQPAPWTDGEVMRLDVSLAGGLKVGFAEFTANAGETNGQKTWRLGSRIVAGGAQEVGRVEVEAGTLKPLHSVWKHTLLGEADAVYYPDHADLKTKGKDETKKLEFDGSIIDNEEAIQWQRCLPFADGYKSSQQILTSLGNRIVPIKFEVSGPQQVQVPAGTYECYKVEQNIGQTFWYSSDPQHYLVKFEAGGAVAELTGVTQRTPGEGAAYADSTFGFSLSAPPGWLFDKGEFEKKDKASVSIIDPQGVATSGLVVQSMSTLKAAETNSLRQFANARLSEDAKVYMDFQARTDSWKDRTLAGQPAVSVVSDYVEGKVKKVAYQVWSFGPTNATCFEARLAAPDFDAFQPKFDAVISSYQTK
jgi:tetratricopeptide (TPR) repeat protein